MSEIHALVGSGEISLDELAAMMPHLDRADVVEQYEAVMASTPSWLERALQNAPRWQGPAPRVAS